MPGCAAVGCTNSAEKGFVMKCFPRDPKRRKEWEIRVRRANWKPTNSSYLCEVHFAPDMWEKTRVDGTRKLKCSAVPTVFFFSSPAAGIRKAPIKRNATTIPHDVKLELDEVPLPEYTEVAMCHGTETQLSSSFLSCNVPRYQFATYSNDIENRSAVCPEIEPAVTETNAPMERNIAETPLDIKLEFDELPNPVQALPEYVVVAIGSNMEPQQSTSLISCDMPSHQSTTFSDDRENNAAVLNAKLDRYEKMYLRERQRTTTLMKILRNTKNRLKIMQESVAKLEQYPLLSQVFNIDQINALEKRQKNKTTKFMKWSNDTLTNALKLKISCGNNGYVELLKQGYPLPSIRTLQRRFGINTTDDEHTVTVSMDDIRETSCVLGL